MSLHRPAIGSDDGGVQMHGLEIEVLVTLGNDGVQPADFGGEAKGPLDPTDHAGPQLFAILNHEERRVRQATDDTVGTVDDQFTAGVLQVGEKSGIGMRSDGIVVEGRNAVFVTFQS